MRHSRQESLKQSNLKPTRATIFSAIYLYLGLRWPTLNAAAADLAPSVVKRPAVGLVQGLHHLAPDGGHGMQLLVPAWSPRTALPSSCLGPHLHLCDDLDRCICSAVVYGSTLQ